MELLQTIMLWVGAVTALLTALIGVFLLVPGDQPEKALQFALDLLKKISI